MATRNEYVKWLRENAPGCIEKNCAGKQAIFGKRYLPYCARHCREFGMAG